MTPPILGIFASAVTGGVSTTSFESIATVSVGSGGSSTITFDNIPGTYTHLQLRGFAKTSTAGTGADAYMLSFNSNTTGTDYRTHYLAGNGSTTDVGGGQTAGIYAIVGNTPRAGHTSMFDASVTDILDYANTNKNKTVRTASGYDLNGSGEVYLRSALWIQTNAITKIDITIYGGHSFAQYSHFALYGIRSA